MLVSDLDLTMVDHQCDEDNISQLRFNALWESNYRHDSLLVFSTGRTPTVYKRLKKDKPMLTSDITIMSVGTEIAYVESMIPDSDWEQLDLNVDKDKANGVIKALSERLKNRGLDIKIVFSGGEALDVLPKCGSKGEALAYLLKKFGHGKQPCSALVCGDSGNDAELFGVPDAFGVMVGNAMEELLQWRKENAKNNPNIIHATERCAAGIIQAIGDFKLVPNLSPRDVLDFSKSSLEITNPGHKIVKFYLFYERRRRAEIADPERHIENLKEIFVSLLDFRLILSILSSGVLVSLSGQEHPLPDYLDQMTKFYGDKQGEQFRVWADRVISTKIGSDTWSVKFDKWELSPKLIILPNKFSDFLNVFTDDGPKGSTSTVLLSLKVSTSDGFVCKLNLVYFQNHLFLEHVVIT
ncbi:hypothetical protein MKW92_048347 [Papaver armeniacum]|nr:hypothetical protein MKW92_048347 [Papaver armeniacum]